MRGPKLPWVATLAIAVAVTLDPQPTFGEPVKPVQTEQGATEHPALAAAKRTAAQRLQSGDPVRAVEAYEDIQDNQYAELSAGERQELRALLLELEYKVGTILLGNIEPGTQVFIDGELRGTTPLGRPLRAATGPRRLKLFKPGYEVLEQRIDVRGGSEVVVTEPLTPEVTTGEMAIQVRFPAGHTLEHGDRLNLLVDGRSVGTPPWRGSVAAGTHRVALEGERWIALERVVQVRRKSVVDVVLTAQPRLAQLEINARSGTIKLNGKIVAERLFSGKVAAGRYRVEVERPGFDTYQTTIEVRAGQRLDVPIPDPSDRSSTPTTPGPAHGYPVEDDSRGADTGLYFDVFGAALFAFESTHAWHSNCPELDDPASGQPLEVSCDTRAPIGGSLGVRLGLELAGVFGVEGFAIAAGDWSRATLSGLELPRVPSYLQSMQVGRVGGVLGGGLRLSTPGSGVHLSVGAGLGLAFRRVYTNVSSLDGSSTNYAVPAAIGDISLRLGDSLTLGVIAWAEFARQVTVEPDLSSLTGNGPAMGDTAAALSQLEKVTVFDGTQLFIGPMLAVHFGT